MRQLACRAAHPVVVTVTEAYQSMTQLSKQLNDRVKKSCLSQY
ncbi:hypothetical protein JCM19233_30 [Vibrio astriarenae]|nr:hypothetical protein JCM19233_30 [Vibrio sp. C7]